MCPVLGTMAPPLGGGWFSPLWVARVMELLPSGAAMEAVLSLPGPSNAASWGILLDLELLMQQCILLQCFRIIHIYEALLILPKLITATSTDRIIEHDFDKKQL